MKVTSRASEVLRALDDQIEDALRDCGEEVVKKAKDYCPVDTGNLRDSIDYDVDDGVLTVKSDVEYAPYVELGTRTNRAQPFLSKAMDDTDFKRILESALGG